MKQLLEVSVRDRDLSSEEDLERLLAEAADQPLPIEEEEEDNDPGEDNPGYSLLGGLSGPQFFIS